VGPQNPYTIILEWSLRSSGTNRFKHFPHEVEGVIEQAVDPRDRIIKVRQDMAERERYIAEVMSCFTDLEALAADFSDGADCLCDSHSEGGDFYDQLSDLIQRFPVFHGGECRPGVTGARS